MTQPNVTQTVPMLGVVNMEASLRFYVDGLGFEMTNKWIPEGEKIRWCWLQLGGAAIMLQEFTNNRLPGVKLGQGVSINFQCKDSLAIYHQVVSRGIPVKTPMVGNAMWVTSLTDPDGYAIHFHSPTDVPEETEYAPIP
ncbi:MAG: VOC family protein [Bryobacteraceae bacterium]|jgi:lactoylglutathione lyase